MDLWQPSAASDVPNYQPMSHHIDTTVVHHYFPSEREATLSIQRSD